MLRSKKNRLLLVYVYSLEILFKILMKSKAFNLTVAAWIFLEKVHFPEKNNYFEKKIEVKINEKIYAMIFKV